MANNSIKTKQLIIPAKYILKCIAEDPETKYPVGVFIRTGKTGSAMYLNTPKEIMDYCRSKDVFQSSLIRIGKTDRGTFVDMKKDGTYMADKDFMPERRHMETLLDTQVKRFYQLTFHPQVAENMEDETL